jgi:hypothetical protein
MGLRGEACGRGMATESWKRAGDRTGVLCSAGVSPAGGVRTDGRDAHPTFFLGVGGTPTLLDGGGGATMGGKARRSGFRHNRLKPDRLIKLFNG